MDATTEAPYLWMITMRVFGLQAKKDHDFVRYIASHTSSRTQIHEEAHALYTNWEEKSIVGIEQIGRLESYLGTRLWERD